MSYFNINSSVGYLAGVIDSDGSISIQKAYKNRKNPNYRVNIQISWNYSKSAKQYFEFLTNTYGGSYFIAPHHQNSFKPGALTIKYSCTGSAAKKLLISIRRELVLKCEQAENCLECLTIKNKRPVNYFSKLEKLYLKNIKLNKKREKRA